MEYLARLCKHRMMLEKDPKITEMWREASSSWYARASMEDPDTRSLYYDLEQLVASNPLQQLYFLTLSLLCNKPHGEHACRVMFPKDETTASRFIRIH